MGLDNGAVDATFDDRDVNGQIPTDVEPRDIVERVRRDGANTPELVWRQHRPSGWDGSNRWMGATFTEQSESHELQQDPLAGLPSERFTPNGPTLIAQQEWEGTVLSVSGTDFMAKLLDITAGATVEEEEATISRRELSDDDQPKVTLGAVFRWVLGYEKSVSGTRRRVSQIVFRDLPRVTAEDVARGEAWADGLLRSFES